MRSNIEPPLYYAASFTVQRRAPSPSTTEYWETYHSTRGNWIDTSIEKILSRVIDIYKKWDIVEIQSRFSRWPNSKIYVAYGPELKDKRKKRFRILITLSNIKVFKSKIYSVDSFDKKGQLNLIGSK